MYSIIIVIAIFIVIAIVIVVVIRCLKNIVITLCLLPSGHIIILSILQLLLWKIASKYAFILITLFMTLQSKYSTLQALFHSINTWYLI